MKKEDIIKLPFNNKIVNKTIINAIKKLKYTMVNLMYTRPPVEIFDNIIMGDIAKNSLIEYLRANTSKIITDYDEIRTDNFEQADPGWDFIFGDNKIKVEVKSSIPSNNENYEKIIKLRDIKITASHNKGVTYIKPSDIIADVHIQVYFYAKTYRKGYDKIEQLYNAVCNNIELAKSIVNINKYSEPLFFGWETKELIKEYANTLKPNTWTFSWTNRIYWRCPINKAKNLAELIDLINNA